MKNLSWSVKRKIWYNRYEKHLHNKQSALETQSTQKSTLFCRYSTSLTFPTLFCSQIWYRIRYKSRVSMPTLTFGCHSAQKFMDSLI